MNRVFKVALTRRLFWLFFSLALVPTLVITLMFSFLRIRTNQQDLLKAERDLTAQPVNTFNMLVSSKADHYQQILDYRGNFIQNLAEFATVGDINEAASQLVPIVEASAKIDPAIFNVTLITLTQTFLVFKAEGEDDLIEPLQVDFQFLSSNPLIWMLRGKGENAVLTAVKPVMESGQILGALAVDYRLDQIVEEVPKYYLADTAVMFLVSDDLTYVGIPSWATEAEYLQDYFDLSGPESAISLLDSEYSSQAEELSGLIAQVSDGQPLLEFTDLTQEPCYIAISKVSGFDLNVVLLLPLAEVFSTAEKYGASLKNEVPTILGQSGLMMLGLMISIGIGAMGTLRTLSDPILELSKGAKEVAKGNLQYVTPVGGIGEIAELGNSFNTMVAAIQSTQSALEEKHTELAEMLETQEKEFALINQVSYQANLTVDLPKKLSSTLEIVTEALGASAGYIYLLGMDNELLRTTTVINPSFQGEQENLFSTHLDVSFAKQILQSKNVIMLDETSELLERMRDLKPEMANCYLVGAPIQFRDRVLGVMSLIYQDKKISRPALENFITALSTNIAILIEVSRLQSQSRFLDIAEERRRVARDLHDSVTQTLFSLSMTLDGVLKGDHDLPAPVLERLSFVSKQALSARSQMRAMIDDLRPLDLGGQTLEEAIKAHTSDLVRATGIQANVDISGDLESIPTPIQYNLDRIVQETLSNIARHAQASEVQISLRVDLAEVELSITDNGVGFDKIPEERNSSFGLMSIRERTEIMGGKVTIASQVKSGTQVAVVVPLQELTSDLENG